MLNAVRRVSRLSDLPSLPVSVLSFDGQLIDTTQEIWRFRSSLDGGKTITLLYEPMKSFTHKQGQYLAFIHYYSKVNDQPPAEADMQRYFRVSPPSVHQMVLTLEANGFIERTPGQGRSIRLLLARENLPDLE